MSDQGSPARVPDGQPDPVLVGPGLTALKDEAYKAATNATPSLPTDKKHQMDSDVPSYFASIPGVNTEALDPSDKTPPPRRRKMSSGQDLLRRLSLTGDASPMSPELDPRAQHPGLKLSGRLISVAFCMPYKLYHQAGSDWVCGDQYKNFTRHLGEQRR
jgi:trehalose 6-phosphate synthase/phosphatase